MHEFPNKPWSASGLDKLIKKIDDTGVQTVLMVVVGLNYWIRKFATKQPWPEPRPVDYSILENLSQRVYEHQRIKDYATHDGFIERKTGRIASIREWCMHQSV